MLAALSRWVFGPTLETCEPSPAERFSAAFGRFDAQIVKARADHGHVRKAEQAKREAVHAALRAGMCR